MRVLTIQGAESLEAVNLKEGGGRGRLEFTKPIKKVSDKVKNTLILHVGCSSVEDRNRITKKTGIKTTVGKGGGRQVFRQGFSKRFYSDIIFPK